MLRASCIETHPCESWLLASYSHPSAELCPRKTSAWHRHIHNLTIIPGLHFLCLSVCDGPVWGYLFSSLRVTRRRVCFLSSDGRVEQLTWPKGIKRFFVVRKIMARLPHLISVNMIDKIRYYKGSFRTAENPPHSLFNLLHYDRSCYHSFRHESWRNNKTEYFSMRILNHPWFPFRHLLHVILNQSSSLCFQFSSVDIKCTIIKIH